MYGITEKGEHSRALIDLVLIHYRDADAMAQPLASNSKPHSPRPWRIGRKVAHNIYDANDQWIGAAEDPKMAKSVVELCNAVFGPGPSHAP